MRLNKALKRVINIIVILALLLPITVAPNQAQASSANFMGARMIKFFQTAQEDIDMKSISESELRVYGVFLSNFYTPGQTQVSDLSRGNDSLARQISTVFFGSEGNHAQVSELNNVIHEATLASIKEGRLTIKDINTSMTGLDLLTAMTLTGDNAKAYRDGKEVIDFNNEAFIGAFKILASQSAGFMFDTTHGVMGMDALYLDAFGNIWGSYPMDRQVGEIVERSSTPDSELHLVLPASLNPLAFMNKWSTVGTDLSNAKTPLNNSFAMGSLLSTDNINFGSDNLTPYYNIPTYIQGRDRDNALYIYGINSPSPYTFNTSSIPNREGEAKRLLDTFYSRNFNNANNYKIVFANRLDVMEKTLDITNKGHWGLVSQDERKHAIINALYSPLVLDINKTISNIWYFGDGGNASWANTTFDKIGMVGINMFGTAQSDGTTLIHDYNQKPTELALYLDSERETITPLGIRENLGFLASSSLPEFIAATESINKSGLTIPKELSIHKVNTARFNPWSGEYYIHGVDLSRDEELYNKLVGIKKDGGIIDSWWDAINTSGYRFTTRIINNLRDNSDFVVFGSDTPREEILFHTLHTYAVSGAKVATNKERVQHITVTKGENNSKNLTVTNDRVTREANWPGIFWGYMVVMLDMEAMVSYTEDGEPVYDTRSFQSTYLPNLPSNIVNGANRIDLSALSGESGVARSGKETFEEMQRNLVQRLYAITSLSPNEDRNKWLKSTLDGFIISTHRAITGSWLADTATVSSGVGSTYSSIVGYVNTPSLYELPFTGWLLTNYMEIYVLTLLVIMVLLILMVLLRMRTPQQGLAIFLVMCLALLFPNILIENTTNIGNKMTDNIYSERFDFWVLTQHEQSVRRLQGVMTDEGRNDLDKIIQQQGELAKNVYSSDPGVRVKWMSPKKSGVFSNMFTSKHVGESLATNLTIFKWLFSSFVYQQEFVSNDPLATYMYRPYKAIVMDAKEYYDIGKLRTQSIGDIQDLLKMEYSGFKGEQHEAHILVPKVVKDVIEASNSYENGRYTDLFYGSTIWWDKEILTKDNAFDIYWSETQRKDITEVTGQYPNHKGVGEEGFRSVSLWGMGSRDINNVIFSNALDTKAPGIRVNLPPNLGENTDIHLLAFYKNTESPYYYFYATLKNRYTSDTKRFKDSLLEVNTFELRDIELESFPTARTNRKVRDFLDMEGLFTNVIPYMTVANEYVYDWTSVNGTSVPSFDFEGGDVGTDDSDVNDTYSTLKKHREDMEKIWMMYTPWVDQLNSLNTSERVPLGGTNVRIQNTLNPSHYLKAGRTMVFSEADMIVKGYEYHNLTEIERRIQRVQENTYRDLMYLVNYYDLDDEVLVSAAAMYATFNFNKEFSQTNLFGESVMLYPQSFEMKNFNYDAFMRLILLNATGEPVFAEQDLYQRVLDKTSFFTGLLLLVVDVLAVIVIPTMKLLILVMLLFLGIILCVTCVVSPPEKLITVITKSLLLPTLLFLVVNVFFAWFVSLLVGEGLTSYVGARGVSIATNDPTVTIVILILISMVYVVALVYIIKLLFSSLKSYGLAGAIAGLGVMTDGVRHIGRGLTRRVGLGGRMVAGATTGAVVGGALAPSGGRFNGMVRGGLKGAKGGAVLRDELDTKARADRQAEAYRKAFGGSGEDFTSILNKKASKTTKQGVVKDILVKQAKTKSGTILGNKLEDVSYKKHRILDSVNKTKHDVIDGVDTVTNKTLDTITKAKNTAKVVKSKTSDIASGRYLKQSISQYKTVDKQYKEQRDTLNKQRGNNKEGIRGVLNRLSTNKPKINGGVNHA